MRQKEEVEPLVSVVCTAYNQEKYIRQCLDGFVMQETDFPIEIIVHDDASTDGTVAIIKEYEERYPGLFNNIYREENWYSQGKNIWEYLFTKVARGKYIALCEGDDYWIDPYKLQKQVDFLEGHPEYYVVGMRSLLFFQGLEYYSFYKDSLHLRTSFVVSDYVKNILMHTSTFCIRKECITHNSYLHDILQGDTSLILHSYTTKISKIKVLKNFGSVYRKHVGGVTNLSLYKNIENSYTSMCKILNSFDIVSNYKMHKTVVYQKKKLKLILALRSSSRQKKMELLIQNMPFLCVVCFNAFLKRFVERMISIYLYFFSSMAVKIYLKK